MAQHFFPLAQLGGKVPAGSPGAQQHDYDGTGGRVHHGRSLSFNSTLDSVDKGGYYIDQGGKMPDIYGEEHRAMPGDQLVQLTPHPQKGRILRNPMQRMGPLDQYERPAGNGVADAYEDAEDEEDLQESAQAPPAQMHPLQLQRLLEQFDTDDMLDLEEYDEYQRLSRPKKSKGLLAKYNLPIVKIGQAHSTTDTHNKKLKSKSSNQTASHPDSTKMSSKERPRWNNFHHNLQSKSQSSQRASGAGGGAGGCAGGGAGGGAGSSGGSGDPKVGAPRRLKDAASSPKVAAPRLVSKPTSEEIEKRRKWKKMRRKLEEDRIKLSMKHEHDKRKEADEISARKKKMAREASLARQHEIQVRIKRIAEEKQKLQMHLIEDLKQNSKPSKQYKTPPPQQGGKTKSRMTSKATLPKLKGQPNVARKRAGGQEGRGGEQKAKKKPGPTKLPRLKPKEAGTPISDTSRANSWKHVRPRIFTNYKAKFINRSTSPVFFEEKKRAEERESEAELERPETDFIGESPMKRKEEAEEKWRLVCTFHVESSSIEPLTPEPQGKST